MKATVIKFFDAEGNEVKNVSTEIELNGELYVKKELEKPIEYEHLVGKWVKALKDEPSYRIGKFYPITKVNRDSVFIKDEIEVFEWFMSMQNVYRAFDISNPLPYNPDTVVGLKELPNDGKVYAECLEDVIYLNALTAIKGLFYPCDNKGNLENNEINSFVFPINGQLDYSHHFRIHTPTPEPILKTCRETMWGYERLRIIQTIGGSDECIKQHESLSKLTKHLNALAYLSEVARRCNGDRVVDFADWSERKYTVIREWNYLKVEWYTTKFNQIAFLDQEARDHSFEVDKHIWNDYYGLPNE
jgi:hypothetical protein